MSWFLSAGMELFHLNEMNFAVFLQVVDLNVAREERYDGGGTAVRNLHQASERRKNRTSE